METYAEITKNTIICMDMQNLETPLFSIGLNVLSLVEYADFKNIINYLKGEGKDVPYVSDKQNTFHTFYTDNLFVYNVVYYKDNKQTSIALIAGPILSQIPNNESLNRIILNKSLPYNKKNEFIGLLNNLPLATSERINQLGKLLLALCKTDTDSWITSRQEIHGNANSTEKSRLVNLNNSNNTELRESELHAMYKFSTLLMDKIIHGDVNGIIEVISEYLNLFLSLDSVVDNNRSLKNRSIMICSIACHFAIQSNVPYERMINNLWRSIIELEKLKAANDILVQMSATIEGFAHAVSTLSNNGYSLYINRVINYIKGHLSENITLKKLAAYVQISPVYLSSLIKKETNHSLSFHINLCRIEESKRLLVYSNKSMQEIAYDIGYTYQTHYNTVFKKFEGQTPLAYRKNMGTKNYVDFIK